MAHPVTATTPSPGPRHDPSMTTRLTHDPRPRAPGYPVPAKGSSDPVSGAALASPHGRATGQHPGLVDIKQVMRPTMWRSSAGS